MYKRIISAALTAMLFATNAHTQGWVHTETKADELTGDVASENYGYTDEDGDMFVFWSSEESLFRIVSATAIFDYNRTQTGERWVDATIGYYDLNDKLVDKNTIQVVTTPGQGNVAEPNTNPMTRPFPNKKRTKKLLEYLQKNQGFVRIVVPLYGSTSRFDIKIPCLKNPSPSR